MARRLDGSYVFRGVIYIPTDDGRVVGTDGQELMLPDDFPSDAELAAMKQKSRGLAGSAPAAMERSIATTDASEAKAAKKRKDK